MSMNVCVGCSVDTAIPKEKKNRRILKDSFLTSWKEHINTATVLPADEILKQYTYLCRSCYSNFEQYHNVKQKLLKNISAFMKHIGPNDTSSPVKRTLAASDFIKNIRKSSIDQTFTISSWQTYEDIITTNKFLYGH